MSFASTRIPIIFKRILNLLTENSNTESTQNLIILSDYNAFVGRFVTRRNIVRLKFHIGRNTVAGDEASERTNITKNANFVDLKETYMNTYMLILDQKL